MVDTIERSKELLKILLTPEFQGSLEEYSENTNWDYIMKSAMFHGVFNLVAYNALRLDKTGILLDKLKIKFKMFLKRTSVYHLLGSRQLREIVLAFKDIPHAILKGPVMADEIYPEAATRPYGDFDVLIPRELYKEASDRLRALGYGEFRLERDTGILREAAEEDINTFLRVHHHAFPFRHPTKDYREIELHWSLCKPAYGCRIIEEKLLEDLLPYEFNGISSWRLSNENLLFHACVNDIYEVPHKFKRICDIWYILVKLGDELNWDKFINDAKEHGATEPVAISLHQMERVHTGLIPQNVLEEVEEWLTDDERFFGNMMVAGLDKPKEMSQGVMCVPIYRPLLLYPRLLQACIGNVNILGSLCLLLIEQHLTLPRQNAENNSLQGVLMPEDRTWLYKGDGTYIYAQPIAKLQKDIWVEGGYVEVSNSRIEASIQSNSDRIEYKMKVTNEGQETLRNMKTAFYLELKYMLLDGNEQAWVETENGLEVFPLSPRCFATTLNMEDVDGEKANELFKAGSNFVGMYNKNTRFGLILSANDVSLIRIAGRYIRIVSTLSDELPPGESAELIFHMYIGVYDDFSEAINKAREELSGAVACLNRGG